jgi:hypothetical protein
MRGYFSAVEYKPRPLPPPPGACFCPPARTLPMARDFPSPFSNFARTGRREISSLPTGKGGSGRRPSSNRGILDQRLSPEGNHIFREETTVPAFFRSLRPPAASRLSPPLKREISSARTDVFFRRFSCDPSSRRWQRLSSDFHSGIDNARGTAGIHPSIIVEDKSSVRRRVVRDNGEKGPVEKNACGGGERTETIIYTVRGRKEDSSSAGRPRNGTEWILARR